MQIDAGSIAIGAMIGTFWWILYIFYIMDKKIEKGIAELGTGKYDDVIGTAAVIAINRIISDKELNQAIQGKINGYAKSFGDQVTGYLNKLGEKYGVTPEMVQGMPGFGGGGQNELLGFLKELFMPSK